MASETVRQLVDNAVEENSMFLEMLIGAFMAANDVGVDDVELVVDTYDPQRIVMYPRLKTEDGEAFHAGQPIAMWDRESAKAFSELTSDAVRKLHHRYGSISL